MYKQTLMYLYVHVLRYILLYALFNNSEPLNICIVFILYNHVQIIKNIVHKNRVTYNPFRKLTTIT